MADECRTGHAGRGERGHLGRESRIVLLLACMETRVLQQHDIPRARRSNGRARRIAISEFNNTHRTLKKGIALTPVKFGISFTAKHLNQAGALLQINTDGSLLINHGGTEMGQGLNI